jgi:small membrane protein
MPIQIILIIIIAVIIARLVYKWSKKELSRSQFILWLIIWLAAIIVIWLPNLTAYLAAKVGVGRGVDLVVYAAIIVAYYWLFRMLLRIEKIEKDITRLVQGIAERDNKKENGTQ